MKKNFFKILPLFLLAIFAFLPFLGNLHDTFLSDDWDFLRIVSSREFPLSHYFTSNYTGSHEGGSYRPMVNVFWFTLYNLFHFHPAPYHAAVILLHTFITLLLYFLLTQLLWNKRFGKLSAFLGALLFTVLPNHSEPVIWVAAVGDILGTFFSLVSLLIFTLGWKKEKHKNRVFYFFFSYTAFALALLCKESSITIPVIRCGITWFVTKETNNFRFKNFLWTLPFFLLVGMFFLLRSHATHLVAAYYGGALSFAPQQLFTSFVHLFLSNFLEASLRVPVANFLLRHFFELFIGICILFILLFYFILKKNSASLLFFGAFVCSIIPVSSFVIEKSTVYLSTEGERWAYLPSLFLSGFVGILLGKTITFLSAKKILLVIFVSVWFVVGAGLFFQLIQKNRYWHTGAELATDTLLELAVEQKKYNFDGAVLIGVPDSMHGVPLFRNMFSTSFEHTTGITLDMIVTPSKTLFDSQAAFAYKRSSKNTFEYFEKNKIQLIAGESHFSCKDYTSSIENMSAKNTFLTGGTTGSNYTLQFSDSFLKQNEKKKIGIFFFDNGKWNVEVL